MNVDFNCPHCRRELRADARHAGRKVRCPDCATLIAVPAPLPEVEESIVELEAAQHAPPQPAHPDQAAAEPARKKPSKRSAKRKAADGVPPTAPHSGLADRPHEAALSTNAPPVAGEKHVDDELTPEPPLIAGTRRDPEDLIDMTAMVDIVFFLLIFFLVTSLQALEAVMNLPTPQANEGGVTTGRSMADLENDPNSIIVRIEEDDSIWVEDAQIFNDEELAFRLRSAKSEGQRRSLLVIGDAEASHGAAVRVFDAGAAAAMNGISFIVQEKSDAN
jgi:biopolymer transport protein ExbD